MRATRSARSARQYEVLEWRQLGVEAVKQSLEPGDVRFRHDGMARNAQFASKIEKVVLHVGQAAMNVLWKRFGEQHADHAVQLVHSADGLDARRVLRDPRPVGKPGGTGVPGARVNLRQALAHGMAILMARQL